MCDDVAAIIRSLGASQACVIGHGLGGAIAWSMPGIHPEVTAAIGVIGMPHPAVFRSAVWRPGHRGARRYVRALQRPLPTSGGRSAQAEVETVPRYLREWSGSDQRWITPEVQQRAREIRTELGWAPERDFRAIRARFVPDAVPDPWDVLGVEPGTPIEDVRAAWRRLVRETHPDRMMARGVPAEAVRMAEKRLVAINRAWEEISAGGRAA